MSMTPKAITDLTTAALAVIVIITMSIIAVMGKPIPDVVVGTVGTIVGAFFGRISNNVHAAPDVTAITTAAAMAATATALESLTGTKIVPPGQL